MNSEQQSGSSFHFRVQTPKFNSFDPLFALGLEAGCKGYIYISLAVPRIHFHIIRMINVMIGFC